MSCRFLPQNRCAAAAKSLQLCLTLCDPKDCSPPGSSVPGILQARILDGVGCHFLLQNRYISDLNLQAVLSWISLSKEAHEDDIFRYEKQPTLFGVFGVTKPIPCTVDWDAMISWECQSRCSETTLWYQNEMWWRYFVCGKSQPLPRQKSTLYSVSPVSLAPRHPQ